MLEDDQRAHPADGSPLTGGSATGADPVTLLPGARSGADDAGPPGRPPAADRPGPGLQVPAELVSDAVLVHVDGRVVAANPAASRLLGHPCEQLLGAELADHLDPDAVGPVSWSAAGAGSGQDRPGPVEVRLRQADGRGVSAGALSTEVSWGGRPGHLLVLHDLTEHQQARSAVRRQAELVSHLTEAIVATDVEGRVTSWNRAAETIFGCSAAQAIGRRVGRLLGTDLEPSRVLATGPVREQLTGPDELVRTLRVSATGLPDGEGYVLVCCDETVQQQAEQRFATVVAALEEGVVVIDEAGRVQSVNKAAERLLDESAQVLLGRRGSSLPLLDEHGEALPAEYHPLMITHRTGRSQQGRIVAVAKANGSRGWLSANSRPLSSGTLPCSAVISFTDVTERRAAGERLEHAATHDALTGLPNRDLLLVELDRAITRARAVGALLAVLYLDLDNFKVINDSVGHEVGDSVLQVAARRVERLVRQGDVVARLGGDEFVVIASITDPADAEALADRLLSSLSKPLSGRLRGLPLNASIGVVTVPRDDGRTATELVRDADSAMYQAKARGRHRAELFDSRLRASVVRRLQLEADLRDGIEGADLWLAYQPLVDLRGGRWVGAEGLSRWDHPALGAITPVEFISIAEQSDLIHTLGHRTLVTGCRDAALLRASGAAEFVVSINLSVRQLDDVALPGLIQEVLENCALPPSGLCLEVTESSLMVAEGVTARTLAALRDLGVSLAIDDFGTGYSSLARLRDLPVDQLKIDGSFIGPLAEEEGSRPVVAGIVALAHALGKRVVAEGVETAGQAEILTELGCDLAQGYYFGRPVAFEEFRLPAGG